MANIPLSRKIGREVDTTRMSLILAEDTLKVVELLALKNRISRCQALARLVEEGLKDMTINKQDILRISITKNESFGRYMGKASLRSLAAGPAVGIKVGSVCPQPFKIPVALVTGLGSAPFFIVVGIPLLAFQYNPSEGRYSKTIYIK